MIKIQTIKGSAQARLLLYRLMSIKLSETEQQLLIANPSWLDQIIEQLQAEIESEAVMKSNEAVLAKAFGHIERSTREGLQRQIERMTGQSLWLGVFPKGLLDSFVGEHQTLIKSVRREYLDKVGLAISRGIREGQLQKDLAKSIRQITDISKHRSQLIARNAPLQYSGALTRHHQTRAGIRQYRWQTSQDERVRQSHEKREGKVFDWNGPGPHPRSEVNCRCDAVPHIT